MGNNLTNHPCGTPARTPTLELTQLQPCGTSAPRQGPEPRGPHTCQLCPVKENQVEEFEKGRPSETASYALPSFLGILKYSYFAKCGTDKQVELCSKRSNTFVPSVTWVSEPSQDASVRHTEQETDCSKYTLKLTESSANNTKSDVKLVVELVVECMSHTQLRTIGK